jgi:hypothetical protein
MKVKVFLLVCAALLCVGGLAFAELPVSVTVDTTGSYSITGQSFALETDASLMKGLNILSGGYVHLGHNFFYEGMVTDTPYIGFGVNPIPYLTGYVYTSLMLSHMPAGTSETLILSPGLTGMYTFESIGLTISDDNCFNFYLPGLSWDYINTLNVSWSFGLSDAASLVIGVENELYIVPAPPVSVTDTITVSAGVEAAPLAFALQYGLVVTPAIDHSIGVNMAFSF